MKDISLEYCHIYTDEEPNSSHLESLKKARQIFEDLSMEGKTTSRVIMIDDYNPIEATLDQEEFKKLVDREGMHPDIYIYEAQLIRVAQHVLRRTQGRIWSQYSRYLSKHNKYPCSFLIACWYALRLGIIEDESIVPKEHVCKEIISILPERFVEVEMLADAILSQLGVNSSKIITRVFY